MRLNKLATKESSNEQPLNGVYHVIIDLHVTADKKVTLEDLQKKVAEAGTIEDIYVEKYIENVSDTSFNIGDTIELTEALSCEKAVYLDTSGSLVISDSPTEGCVEKVGDFTINLSRGLVAEINQKPVEGFVNILFSAETIELPDLQRVAYLGILSLPCGSINKI